LVFVDGRNKPPKFEVHFNFEQQLQMVDAHDLLEQFLFEYFFELLQVPKQQLYQQEAKK
jgi:hypothetical protein